MQRKKRTMIHLAAMAFTVLSLAMAWGAAFGASMYDYCVKPPLIGASLQPNLLLMLDNSSSMYDLAHQDMGTFGECSADHNYCVNDGDCFAPQTCQNVTARTPTYCYDQTYSNNNAYSGYFETKNSSGAAIYYKLNTQNNTNPDDDYFEITSSFPSSCDIHRADTLCLDDNDPPSTTTNITTALQRVLKTFVASGNFLNWLTQSKFDVEKEVLTGGKYSEKVCSNDKAKGCIADSECPSGGTCSVSLSGLIAESRGCVGRKFVKEVLKVNYSNLASAPTNTSLGVSFGVNGPTDKYNLSAPSPGGLTYLDIYLGDYNASVCQSVIDAYAANNLGNIKQALDACLGTVTAPTNFCAADPSLACTSNANCKRDLGNCTNNKCSIQLGGVSQYCANNAACRNFDVGPCVTTTATTAAKQQAVFSQSLQACWADKSGTPISRDDINSVQNFCKDIYAGMTTKVCTSGLFAGQVCTLDAQCGFMGEKCERGPMAILPGDPAYLCNNQYAGRCAQSSDGWVNTAWYDALGVGLDTSQNPNLSAPENCIQEQHKQFCNDTAAPPIVDPSITATGSTTFANLPAIVSDIGVQVQLGQPVYINALYGAQKIGVRVKTAAPPAGLIQKFSSYVRFGAMGFNVNGSPTECKVCTLADPCGANDVPCPNKCQNKPDVSCSTKFDCPLTASGGFDSCVTLSRNTENKDGAKILNYIGHGHCSVSTTTECASRYHCPDPEQETCISNPVGEHTTDGSIIRNIDNLRAVSWTPFSEGLYNAMGYFAKKDGDSTKKMSRSDLRINADDFRDDLNPSDYDCQRNNILLLTDGMSTADMNGRVLDVVRNNFTASDLSLTMGSDTCGYLGSKNLDNVADLIRHYNIRTLSPAGATARPTGALVRQDYVNVHVVLNSATTGTTVSQCDAETLLTETATKGGTALMKASNPAELEQALAISFQQIAADTVSGTAASVLASGEGSGANLVQAVFYPTKEFEKDAAGNKTSVSWIGRLANMWYYVDPLFSNSNIREDEGNRVLDLKTDSAKKDYITQLYFDMSLQTAMANRWTDANGDGSIADETLLDPIPVDKVSSLWEAGKLLWARDFTMRNILMPNITGAATANNLMEFRAYQAAVLQPYLQAVSSDEANAIIQWVRGSDTVNVNNYGSGYRKRSVKITVDGIAKTFPWKLGDILNSTPKISSWQPLNDYHKVYGPKIMGDGTSYENTYAPVGVTPYQSDPVNVQYYTTAYRYKGRGMVYAGGNDGMLHAFRLGLLEQKWSGQGATEKAKLTAKACLGNEEILCTSDTHCPGGSCSVSKVLGEEVWAFIPKNMLPYLKYMTDPAYCHIYGVDLTPFIFDASIAKPFTCTQTDFAKCLKTKDSWRTILIGGMRTGGACRGPNASCTDCVKAPIADSNGTPIGFSSYFALDITNQNDPVLMWEYNGFTPVNDTAGNLSSYTNKLGFSTSGPAIVRINANHPDNPTFVDQTRNGKWFVVFASGPTGPIETSSVQFLGRSDQNLHLHIFDLAAGPGTNGANVVLKDTGIPNGFGGSLYNATHDVDLDYTDEIVYFPYVSFATSAQNYRGGVGRLMTRKQLDPNAWEITYAIQNSGPISSAVTKIQDNNKKQLWLFFGSGRYFFAKGDGADDPNPAKRRQLFGMKDSCLNSTATGFLSPCPAALGFCDSPASSATCGGMTNVDDVNVADSMTPSQIDSSSYKGWYIDMQPAEEYTVPGTVSPKLYYGERVITDPVASSNGIVYFTSYRPYNDPCDMGGISHLWAVKFNTGGSPAGLIKGKAIIQVSTGSIEQLDLASVFTEAGSRKTPGIVGVPPMAQGLSIISSPKALKKVVHIKER